MKGLNNIVGWGGIIVIIVVTIETMSYGVGRFVVLPKIRNLVYNPPESIVKVRYDDYMAKRDQQLGWPGMDRRNKFRQSPAFPDEAIPCISLYGDSFTYAEDVSDEEAWGNVLSEKTGCRVANFGVGGYGTDQAYLRFRGNAEDNAPITILGIYPHNALRNVNQYRYLLTGGSTFGFKPRFVLDNGELRLITISAIDYKELVSLFNQPKDYLHHETFLPDTEYGPTRFSFPFTASLFRLAGKEQVINWMMKRPGWYSFWQPNHPSLSMETMSAIASAFSEECDRRTKNCLVIVFPTPASYDWYQAENELVTRTFISELEKKGIAILDVTVLLEKKLGGTRLCKALTRITECKGHLNAWGNRVLADIVYDHLESLGWVTALKH